jgi:glycosyltransferase involved in cell wall biosynthesis
MRIIFLSIEFSIGTFSGNGIYAISQVLAWRRLGHEVLVICGRPAALSPTAAAAADANLLSIPLPVWNRLDLECSWKKYTLGCGAPYIVNTVVNFRADVVLGVDWHSYQAYQNLHEALEAEFYRRKSASSAISSKVNIPPYACSNYRVYLRSLSPNDKDFNIMKKLEGDSLLQGICSTVLSASDKNFVENNYFLSDNPPPPLTVILPALRADLAAIPLPQVTQERKYLLCCVRASPEKEPHRFINLICELEKRNFFDKNGIIPLIAGSGWKVTSKSVVSDPPYHEQQQQEQLKTTTTTPSLMVLEKYVVDLREQINTYVPCCQVIEEFLGPIEMAQIYSQTVLNIHPPLYDAFGMTCCEAASQMAPSLVAGKGHIGATDLLREERGEIFVTDMEDSIENLADTVEKMVENREMLNIVGETAAKAVRKWNADANAAAMVRVLMDSLDSYMNSSSSRNALKEIESQEAFKEALAEPVPLPPSPCLRLSRRGIDVLVPRAASDSTNNVEAEHLMYKYFEENYLAMNKPVLFSGIATEWLATKEFVDSSTGSIHIENLERKFGGSRVVATDAARRHHGEGPCKEMSLAEYCQWWREHQRGSSIGGEENVEEESEKDHLWYLKDWHFVKDIWSSSKRHNEREKDSADLHYYRVPMYFSDDWLNEWYDHLSSATTSHGIETEDAITPATRTEPLPRTTTAGTTSSQNASDYRFVYLGPRNSSTPLHTDVLHSHSWSANIAGRKLWRVLPAEYASLVQDKSTGTSHIYDFYPSDIEGEENSPVSKKSTGTMNTTPSAREKSTTKYTAKSYPHRQYSSTSFPDINTRFPGLQQAQHHILETIQYPGEAIFIPSGWYHTVLNVDDCLSINHNWISTNSVMSSWRYLQKERTRAENLIEDCRELNSVAEFEMLVQRNVEMNAGLGYSKFGSMVRYVAETAAGMNREEKKEIDFARLAAAENVLSELLEEQEKVFLLDAGDTRNDNGSMNEEEEEKIAKEALESEIRLNKRCLELITTKTLGKRQER